MLSYMWPKATGMETFFDFIDLQGKKQVQQILSNFTKVAGCIPFNYI